MKHVSVYWSNICVLHKGELALLARVREDLAKEGIELSFTFFGLGYPCRLSGYLKRPDTVQADVMVSTDLEVFEDASVFRTFSDDLLDLEGAAQLKSSEGIPQVRRDARLLPYVVIPLVCCARSTPAPCGSLEAAAEDAGSLAFGGINNSAAKSVVKTVWSLYGRQAAENLLSRALVTPMPVAAYQAVRTGVRREALVPALFALSDPKATVFLPREGAVAVPSFITCRRTLTRGEAEAIVQAFNRPEFHDLYVREGRLVCAHRDAPANAWMVAHGSRFALPSPAFLTSVDHEEFFSLYRRYLPSARDGAE